MKYACADVSLRVAGALAALTVQRGRSSRRQALPPVSLAVPGGSVEGTLLMPACGVRESARRPHHCGLGPDRSRRQLGRCLPGQNNSYRMLAEALAAQGIASLRYDKRGIGASKVAESRRA